MKKTKGYKGFKKDFTCQGFQYEVGKTYKHEGEVTLCAKGFHYCEHPMDVWSYYDIADSKFAEVEAGESQKDGDKSVTADLTIKKELTLTEMIAASIEVVFSFCFKNGKPAGDNKKADEDYAQIGSSGHFAKIGSSGDAAKIGSSGNAAQIGSSGDYAQIGSSGYSAKIGSSGYSAKIGSSGDSAKIGSSGDSARIVSSGYFAQIGSSGNYTKIGSSGYSARIVSSGDCAKIDSTGKNSIASGIGNESRAKAKNGSWIVLAEWKMIDGEYTPTCVKTGRIGKDGLKEDTWYALKDGEFVECK